MSKKRKSNKKFTPFHSKHRTKNSPGQTHVEQAELIILRILYHSHTPITLPEILDRKAVKKFDKKLSKQAVSQLLRDGLAHKTSKSNYALHPAAPLYKGKIIQNTSPISNNLTGLAKSS